jgi:hypothetical protein
VDAWYVSSWYAGPWYVVEPYDVPVYLLRVPVRYYHHPPPYFRAWRGDLPPRWGERWGRDWEVRRSGWDRWDHRQVPRPAPLPVYQRSYAGDRYPREVEQQRSIRTRSAGTATGERGVSGRTAVAPLRALRSSASLTLGTCVASQQVTNLCVCDNGIR